MAAITKKQQHVVFVLQKRKHVIIASLREVDLISLVLDCYGGNLFLTSGRWILPIDQGRQTQLRKGPKLKLIKDQFQLLH